MLANCFELHSENDHPQGKHVGNTFQLHYDCLTRFTGQSMIPPPRGQFWRDALIRQGSISPKVLPRVLAFGVIAWIISQILYAIESWLDFRLELQVDPFVVAGLALGLLLVLKTNAGYDRWWEAHELWDGIVNLCRNLAIDAQANGGRDATWRERFIRLVEAFPYICSAHLRDEDPPELVVNLLGGNTFEAIRRSSHRPCNVAFKLAQMLKTAREEGGLDDCAFLQMDRKRATLIDGIGDCERIVETPLARVYSIKVRRFITLFLVTLPLPLLHKVQAQWAIPIFTMIAAYPLLSLDEIEVELQNPFKNNLSLDINLSFNPA